MVAGWFETDPVFVLGSMLPDLASILGTRLNGAGAVTLAAGVALHHRTDAAFHRLPGFHSLCGEATVRFEFAYDGGGPGKGGVGTLFVNDKKVGEGRIEATQPVIFSATRLRNTTAPSESAATTPTSSPPRAS